MDKELISLLVVHGSGIREQVSGFSKSNGFLLQECEDFSTPADSAGPVDLSGKTPLKQPDLILIESEPMTVNIVETHINKLLTFNFKVRPTIFLVMPKLPDSQTREAFMGLGVDEFLISPFSIWEVRQKYRPYLQVKHLNQEILARDVKVEKSLGYLDKFKIQLQTTKADLYEERTTLNNALKQINQMTLERKRLKKEKQEVGKILADNMEGFLDLLSHLIKTRIETNRGHGERVAHICRFVGRQLKLDEKKLEDLEKAAMLHEAGLLLIPEKTLQTRKDGQSGYEKDLFVQYPVKGADLLSNCTRFDASADIIRGMNENSDGSGSPQGLKRRYIPLPARILAGADVFDTLKDEPDVSSLDIFLEKLEAFSGTRLDPNIVACLEKYAVLHMGSDDYRVKGVGIHQLEPGMKLGTALFTCTGTKLFSVNTLLTTDAIDKIKKYNREYHVDDTVYIRA